MNGFDDTSLYNDNLMSLTDMDLSEFEKQLLYIWVEHRTSNKQSCIYTSNIHPNNFDNIFGPRVADRIIGYSTIIEIKGQSRRNDTNFLEVIK